MPKQSPFALALSLCLLSACSVQEAKQAVQVNAPTTQNTNSNNQSNTTQTNTGSGTQVNNNGSGSSNTNTGTQTNNTNSGSGNQTSNTNTGSGNQTNTTVNNTQTGNGTIIQPVNTGDGSQTNTIVTGNQNNTTNNVNGNQTVVNGTQTNNTTTVNNQTTIINQIVQQVFAIPSQSSNIPKTIPADNNPNSPQNGGTTSFNQTLTEQKVTQSVLNWPAVSGATKYTIFSNNQVLQETTATTVTIPVTNLNQKIAVVASNSTATPSTPSTNEEKTLAESFLPTTLTGKVFDGNGSPLSGATIQVGSQNPEKTFQTTATTGVDGSYTINNVPTGLLVSLRATKQGFATRELLKLIEHNPQNTATINKFDFGNTSPDHPLALTNKPEVIAVSPAPNSTVDPRTAFVLKFSQPMNRQSVQDTFAIRSFSNRKLSVDLGSANSFTLTGLMNLADFSGTQIWDKSTYNIYWNMDDTEVTFSPTEEKSLPTDREPSRAPEYQMAFKSFGGSGNRTLQTAAGVSRSSHHFQLSGTAYEESNKFSVNPDTLAPQLSSLQVETAENGGLNGDAIRVRFSERMIHYTYDTTIAGGMENTAGSATKAPAAYPGGSVATGTATACNYQIRVVRAGSEIMNTSWCNLPGGLSGRALYSTDDPTHKSVLLLPPNGADIYKPGDTILLTVATTVMDPAGNTLSPSQATASANAS